MTSTAVLAPKTVKSIEYSDLIRLTVRHSLFVVDGGGSVRKLRTLEFEARNGNNIFYKETMFQDNFPKTNAIISFLKEHGIEVNVIPDPVLV